MANTNTNKKLRYKVEFTVLDRASIEPDARKTVWAMPIMAVSAACAIENATVQLRNWYGLDMRFSQPVAHGRARASAKEWSTSNFLVATVE